jgi:putative Flp pilus-assembly TadE/G-like protein
MTVVRRRHGRDQRGALTPAVVVMALGLLLLGGLVTDGGRQLNAQLQARGFAEEAARAGANPLVLTERQPSIDRAKSVAEVGRYCAVARQESKEITSCRVTGFGAHKDPNGVPVSYVEVTVEMSLQTTLFGIIGIHTLHVSESATASEVEGIQQAGDQGPGDQPPSIQYPTGSLTIPTSGAPTVTSFPFPTIYTTIVCGLRTVLPVTLGQSCVRTSVPTTITKPPPPPPPPPRTTITRTIPTRTPSNYPTTVTPSGW